MKVAEMLLKHPDIRRVSVHETLAEGGLAQRLVIETDLPIPESGDFAENSRLESLRAEVLRRVGREMHKSCRIEFRQYRPDSGSEAAPGVAA